MTNEVNTCEYGQSSKMARRSSSSQRLNEGNEGCSTKSPVFYLPTRLSTYNNPMRRNPLPNFDWANSGEVWKAMLSKEFVPSLRRDPKMFSRHPGLDERMRSILLDWMIEVVYQFPPIII